MSEKKVNVIEKIKKIKKKRKQKDKDKDNVNNCKREAFGKNTPGSDNDFEVPRHQSPTIPHTTHL